MVNLLCEIVENREDPDFGLGEAPKKVKVPKLSINYRKLESELKEDGKVIKAGRPQSRWGVEASVVALFDNVKDRLPLNCIDRILSHFGKDAVAEV